MSQSPSITVLNSPRVPSPKANYSQGVRVGDLLFLAGQLPTDFVKAVPDEVRIDGAYPYYGSAIEKQTRLVLTNIAYALEDFDSSLERVLKTQVFLKDLNDFHEFDRVWREFFVVPPPRSTVQVGEEGLLVPGALLEVDIIAAAVGGSEELVAVPGDTIPKPLANYTPCTQYGDLLFLAGQLPTDFSKQGVPAEASPDPEFPYCGSRIEMQTEYTLKNIKALLEEAGSDLDHVVKAQVFLRDLNDFHGFDDVWRRYFETPPPRTTVQVGDLLVADALLEIDIVAVRRGGRTVVERIEPDGVPMPLAAYSPATRAGDLVFLAGQLATDFDTGIARSARLDPAFPYYGSSIEKQTEYILANCARVLESAGSSLAQVTKAQVFIRDLQDFHGFDKVWKRYFEVPPARTTVQVPGGGLLIAGALVEIDLIGAVT